jgi:hypothetical protein
MVSTHKKYKHLIVTRLLKFLLIKSVLRDKCGGGGGGVALFWVIGGNLTELASRRVVYGRGWALAWRVLQAGCLGILMPVSLKMTLIKTRFLSSVDERGKHFRSSHGTREERSWEDGSRGL